MKKRRWGKNKHRVAAVLLAEPDAKHWGWDLSRIAGLRSGVVYPILGIMLEDGWLADGWEDPSKISGRPPRRYYIVTALGREQLGRLIEHPPE